MKTRGGVLFAAAMVACLCSNAFGDGGFFGRLQSAGTAKVRIPDQSALITFDGKTERLVIETSAESKGNDFAWIVPVPAVPKIEPATTGLFPTLRMITRPQILPYIERSYMPAIVCLAAALLLWFGIFTRRWFDVLVFAVFLSIFLWTFMPASRGLPGGRHTMAADTLQGAGSFGQAIAGVTVHDRHIVGAYDTVTLSGKDGVAVTDWLKQNGFVIPEKVQPVLDQYANEGWVFVASKLRKEHDDDQLFTPHPLSFTFPATRAVYPMRLTGIDNGPLSLDLYVAGDSEAAAKSFARRCAGHLSFAEYVHLAPFETFRTAQDSIPMVHDKLASYCKGLTGMTLLSATLSPGQMKDDIYLNWKPLKPFRLTYHAEEEAKWLTARWLTGCFLVCTLLCAILYRPRYSVRPGIAAVSAELRTYGRSIAALLPKAAWLVAAIIGLGGLVAAGNLMADGKSRMGLPLFFAFALLLEFALYRLLRRPGQASRTVLSWAVAFGTLIVFLAVAALAIWSELPDELHSPQQKTHILNSEVLRILVPLFVAFLLVVGFSSCMSLLRAGQPQAPSPRHLRTAAYGLLLVAFVSALVGLGVYNSIPTLPESQILSWNHKSESLGPLPGAMISRDPQKGPADIGALRQELAAAYDHVRNPWTGAPVREEDSPGNYSVELLNGKPATRRAGKPAYFYYDGNGLKVLMGTYSEGQFAYAQIPRGKVSSAMLTHEAEGGYAK